MNLESASYKNTIDNGVQEYRETPHSVLVDVRTSQEYNQGHIPGSINIPLQEITEIFQKIPDKNTPLFVYCHSGMRSAKAANILARAGYQAVKNIGGIMLYNGSLEL